MNLQEPKEAPKSGNYFGWKFSFFGLFLIIITLLAALYLGPPKGDYNFLPTNEKETRDSVNQK